MKSKVKKYLNPLSYARYVRNQLIRIRLMFGKPFPVWTEALGEKICFIVSSDKEYWMRAKGSYTVEKTTMSWISDYVSPDDVVYDIGANVGAYSLLIGKRNKDGIVYSFEPESSNYYSLNRNIISNQLSDKIFAFCMAFDKEQKVERFFLSSVIPGSATHSVGIAESEGMRFNPAHQQGIFTMSLDGFVKIKNVKFPNHMKIDVDGNEGLIIEGGKKTLSDKRVKTVVIEIADNISKGRIEKIIQSSGLTEIKREELNNGDQGKIFNILYIRK